MDNYKLSLEYVLNCSPKSLYTLVSLPSGLTTWFADRVDRVGDSLNIFWGKSSEIADVISTDGATYIRYQWERDRGTERYFELSIHVSDIAKVVSLTITILGSEEDIDDAPQLWDNSIENLKRNLGIK